MINKIKGVASFLLAVVFGLVFGVAALLGILYSIPAITGRSNHYD
jgi:hypothetical protein